MWNQDWWTEKDYDADEWDRFPKGAGFPGRKADWGWVQIISPSRYIHTGEGEEYRPIAEIVEELWELDDDARTTSEQLNKILAALRIS